MLLRRIMHMRVAGFASRARIWRRGHPPGHRCALATCNLHYYVVVQVSTIYFWTPCKTPWSVAPCSFVLRVLYLTVLLAAIPISGSPRIGQRIPMSANCGNLDTDPSVCQGKSSKLKIRGRHGRYMQHVLRNCHGCAVAHCTGHDAGSEKSAKV